MLLSGKRKVKFLCVTCFLVGGGWAGMGKKTLMLFQIMPARIIIKTQKWAELTDYISLQRCHVKISSCMRKRNTDLKYRLGK